MDPKLFTKSRGIKMKFAEYINEATHQAYFISPRGELVDTNGRKHIDMIIKYPKKFGLTKEFIADTYDKYNEKMNLEGKAREEIIILLVKQGWTRIRLYTNKFWSINVPRMTKKMKDYLRDWSSKMINTMKADKHMMVKIRTTSRNYTDNYDMPLYKIAQDALYNESEIHIVREVLIERDIEDLNGIEEYILNEAGYSRLMRIMSGLVPSIKTFAIVTWENPMGDKKSKEFNKGANDRFKKLLKHGKFSYKQIKGKYGLIENPFIIFNISLNSAKSLGRYEGFEQESIIFGELIKDRDKEGIVYKMIYLDGSNKIVVRKVWRRSSDDDFYSEYKGRKFQIPFFEKEFVGKIFKDGKVVDECDIYYEKDFAYSSIEKLEIMRNKLLDEYRSGRSLYENRGLLSLRLDDLKIKVNNGK